MSLSNFLRPKPSCFPSCPTVPKSKNPSPELKAQCLIALMSNPLIVEYVHKEGIKPGKGSILEIWCKLAEEYAAELRK